MFLRRNAPRQHGGQRVIAAREELFARQESGARAHHALPGLLYSLAVASPYHVTRRTQHYHSSAFPFLLISPGTRYLGSVKCGSKSLDFSMSS
jgi:hypothetical protein